MSVCLFLLSLVQACATSWSAVRISSAQQLLSPQPSCNGLVGPDSTDGQMKSGTREIVFLNRAQPIARLGHGQTSDDHREGDRGPDSHLPGSGWISWDEISFSSSALYVPFLRLFLLPFGRIVEAVRILQLQPLRHQHGTQIPSCVHLEPGFFFPRGEGLMVGGCKTLTLSLLLTPPCFFSSLLSRPLKHCQQMSTIAALRNSLMLSISNVCAKGIVSWCVLHHNVLPAS